MKDLKEGSLLGENIRKKFYDFRKKNILHVKKNHGRNGKIVNFEIRIYILTKSVTLYLFTDKVIQSFIWGRLCVSYSIFISDVHQFLFVFLHSEHLLDSFNFGWKLLRTSAQSAILSLLLWGQQCFRKWKVLSEDDNEVTNDPDVCGVWEITFAV
jgi:hypothetical protein